MFVGFDGEDDESLNSRFEVTYVIVRSPKDIGDAPVFLADYDDADMNIVMWHNSKKNAYEFKTYAQAEKTLTWLKSLKIEAKIQDL